MEDRSMSDFDEHRSNTLSNDSINEGKQRLTEHLPQHSIFRKGAWPFL